MTMVFFQSLFIMVLVLKVEHSKMAASPIQGSGLSQVRIVRTYRKELLLLSIPRVVEDSSRRWIVDKLT